jgi:hypothetical protein
LAHLNQLLTIHGLFYRKDYVINHVTTKLVKDVLHDLAKVIVDHASAPKKEKKHVDTGKFKRIYKGV